MIYCIANYGGYEIEVEATDNGFTSKIRKGGEIVFNDYNFTYAEIAVQKAKEWIDGNGGLDA